jgi:hypothetical protein
LSSARRDARPSAATPRAFFWVMFWSTLLILALLYVYAEIRAQTYLARISQQAHAQTALISEDFYREWAAALPEAFSELQPALESATHDMAQRIATRIDKAFEPVYDRLPLFLDFHYSVVGEYTELAAALSDRVGSDFQRILFDESGFERHLDAAVEAIGNDGEQVLGGLLEQMRRTLEDHVDMNEAELGLLARVGTLTLEDAQERFGTGEVMLKSASAAIGGSAVAAMLAKTVSAKAATKLGAKAAGKTAIKATGVGGSAAGGAAAGLLCGPAAWICAPVGGVTAAVAAWFATDKVVIEIDEYLNRDAFEREIRAAIDAERERIGNELATLYRDRFAQLIEDNRARFSEMSTRELIEGRK